MEKKVKEVKKVSSWMGRHSRHVEESTIHEYQKLRSYLAANPGATPAGNYHSYNDAAVGTEGVKFRLGWSSIHFHEHDNTVTVHGRSTVGEVMRHLRNHGRKLINVGNHRRQTFIGAIVGGTHGFGEMPYMRDAVVRVSGLDANGLPCFRLGMYAEMHVVTSVTVRTEPLTSYVVDNCVCELDDWIEGRAERRAALLLPYSKDYAVDRGKLTVLAFNYTTNDGAYPPMVQKKLPPFSWIWRTALLNFWWSLDKWVPMIGRSLQTVIGFLKVDPWTMTTNPEDLDSTYHPHPWVDDGTDFVVWAYKPTYTSDNTAFSVSMDELKSAIDVVSFCKELRGFIGLRELKMKGGQTRVGVDLYCTPSKINSLVAAQNQVAKVCTSYLPHATKAEVRS